jgi:hypothetical protein
MFSRFIDHASVCHAIGFALCLSYTKCRAPFYRKSAGQVVMNSSQHLSRRFRRFCTGALAAKLEAHVGQGLIQVAILSMQPLSPRRDRVPPWEVFLWGHQADAQTGGHALTEEASIEGRFR